MPAAGGRCRKLWKETAVTMVSRNRTMIRLAPNFMLIISAIALRDAPCDRRSS